MFLQRIACHRQSSGIFTYSLIFGSRQKKNLSPLLVHYCNQSSSFSTGKVIYYWKHSLSSTLSPPLQRSMLLAPRRKLCNNTTSKTKISTASTSATDTPSFFQNLYNDTNLLLQSLRELFFVDLPILLPRLIAFAGTFHLTSEYGFKTFQCEGPSMEPTIIDGSHTNVIIDRWSHRIFGLEKNVNRDDKNTTYPTEEGTNLNNHAKENENSFDSWFALLRGVWQQHFASGLQHGDVIILHHPSKEATICKRIIGMPGDTVVRTDGGDSQDSNHRIVPPGHLWIEGDNSRQSLDSRSYGTVPASLVIGKVICRLWPLREYASLGLDGNGIEHWRRVSARIGRGSRPLPGNPRERFSGSHLLTNERSDVK